MPGFFEIVILAVVGGGLVLAVAAGVFLFAHAASRR
jgi:hypothetical protein